MERGSRGEREIEGEREKGRYKERERAGDQPTDRQ